jgi:hypothetical protein
MNRRTKDWLWGVIAGMCLMGIIDEVRSKPAVHVTLDIPKITIKHGA